MRKGFSHSNNQGEWSYKARNIEMTKHDLAGNQDNPPPKVRVSILSKYCAIIGMPVYGGGKSETILI